MKKLSLALALLLLLTACTTGTPSGSSSPEPTVTTTPTSTPNPVSPPSHGIFTDETMPRLDGSTSLLPYGQAAVSLLTGSSIEEVVENLSFNRTSQSFRMLAYEMADIIITAPPAESVVLEIPGGLDMAQFATDALVFVVNADNPIDSLTAEELRSIYTGEVTNWAALGGADVPILAFQRNAESGSQVAMVDTLMKDAEMMEPPIEYSIGSMSGLLEAMRNFDGSEGAIGYTMFYYANDMRMAEGLKILEVNGVEPDAESISSGEYPFLVPYYVTVREWTEPESPAGVMRDWILSEDGQMLAAELGYVPVMDVDIAGRTRPWQPPGEIYDRLSDAPLTELVPSERYGQLLPYTGKTMGVVTGGYTVKYGLVTENGLIVTDPIYDSIDIITTADPNDTRDGIAKFYSLSKAVKVENGDIRNRVAIVSADGSLVTDSMYEFAYGTDGGIFAMIDWEGDTAVLLDHELKPIVSTDDLSSVPFVEGSSFSRADALHYYNEGVLPVPNADGSYYFIDMGGNRIPSPENTGQMRNVSSFVNGIARTGFKLSDSQTKTGYLRYDGEKITWLVEPVYEHGSDFSNGRALVSDGYASFIIDESGETLKVFPEVYTGTHMMYGTNLRILERSNGGYYEQIMVDDNFDPLTIGGYAIEENSIYGVPYAKADGGIWVQSPENGVDVFLPGAAEPSYACRPQSGMYIVFLEDGSSAAIDENGAVILSASVDGSIDACTDTETGEVYYMIYSLTSSYRSTYKIYDSSGKLITSSYSGRHAPCNGLFACHDSLTSGYKNLNDEWVFRMSSLSF